MDANTMQGGPNAQSNVPKKLHGKDLRTHLNTALAGNLEFKGSYYYSATDAAAPNPGLTIDGVGLIGLPLSERDAKVVISHASQAPFGRGDQTIVDTTVRDTWEIEPASVKFQNPKWEQYVELVASKSIWTALGVAPWTSKPRCELYKLLLHQTGSHFLPHQDTYKADGMFATVVFVLPSLFEGGEVHVSHAGQNAIIDASKHSQFNTSILAWYTDVMHEVKPITSGYRLALSYNLIHTSPNTPQPSLPEMHTAVAAIRKVLTSWNNGDYELEQNPPLIAYLLSHEYNIMDFNKGVQSLKGSDAHKVAHLLPIAQELGFSICLANLTYTQHGYGNDNGGGYYKRNKWGYDSYEDDDEDDDPGMAEVEEESYEISNSVRIAGGRGLAFGDFTVEEGCLVPENPFQKVSPDRTEYEGYMGNGAGSLDYWYDRSVLIIYRNEDEIPIMLEIKGGAWAIRELDLSPNTPTEHVKAIASAALAELKSGRNQTPGASALALMNYAVSRADAELWNNALPFCASSPSASIGEAVGKALDAFGLAPIQAGIEGLIDRISRLNARVEVVDTIMLRVGDEADPEWSAGLLKNALASYNAGAVEDAPALVTVLQRTGLDGVQKSIIPNISKQRDYYRVFVALAKELHQRRNEFPEQADQNSSPSVADAIRQCILAAVQEWQTGVGSTGPIFGQPAYFTYGILRPTNPPPIPTKFEWVAQLVDLCFLVGDLEPCSVLFCHVLQHRGSMNLPTMFTTVYTPLVTRLKAILKDHGRQATEEPFGSFMKTLIFLYLSDILGSSKALPKLNRVVKCSATCKDCVLLERWVNDLNSSREYNFKAGQDRRSHLERCLRPHSDLLMTRTTYSGNPHTLVVSKRLEVLEQYTWKGRQNDAVTFLEACGTDEELAGIVKDRYGDVLKAVQGTQSFSTSVGTSSGSVVQQTGMAVGGQASTVAGAKRKHREPPKNVIDVIDLT
ncbi:hypothetical protein EST38_g13476 [Candolleomyces aberdarensis]|uniref:Prolyl 4-hydroxylase alpha subunit Fe(2+) 2OG dioxygenase domain-containing protein n=1 Tax=Candolleomyces aberdarensis TaxID=2316362 RepID=A0A4Q2CZV4_9AGAR|nr:hypothetical protein EST38_g13476 [Candolleomyces aberdarensis]